MRFTSIIIGFLCCMLCCQQRMKPQLMNRLRVFQNFRKSCTQAAALYPQWHWSTPVSQFRWKPKIPSDLAPPKSWRHGHKTWTVVIGFLADLKWKCSGDESISFCAFHADGRRLPGDQSGVTFRDLYKILREALLFLHKSEEAQPFPGSFNSTKPRACGRIMPQGCIEGAAPYVSAKGLTMLAQLFCLGADRRLETWTIPVHECGDCVCFLGEFPRSDQSVRHDIDSWTDVREVVRHCKVIDCI